MSDKRIDGIYVPLKVGDIITFNADIDYNGTKEIVTHYIYEAITLSLPLKMVHPDDEEGYSTCNEEAIKALENLAPAENKDIDPRWDKLKSFKN